jgi:hypothetical protein
VIILSEERNMIFKLILFVKNLKRSRFNLEAVPKGLDFGEEKKKESIK